MYIIGVDVGTSGAKAAVFERAGGAAAAVARVPYTVESPEKGQLELNPETVWAAVQECLRSLAKQADVSRAGALAVSTQGEAMIPVDGNGMALMNAILTFDARNAEEYNWFSRQMDRGAIMSLTGMPAHPMFSATKLLWLKRHQPQIFQKAWKFMCFGDFIAFKLGAEPAIDYSMASRTMLFDLRKREWSPALLELCGIPAEKLPLPVPAGTPIGTAGPALTELGYPAQMPLIAGSHDQVCCALGAGVFQGGVAMDSLGTTESIVCVSRELCMTEQMLKYRIPVYSYPGSGLYAYMTFLTCGASLLEWFRTKVLDSTDDGFYQEFDQRVAELRGRPSDIYVVPHFAGAGTPSMDFCAQGMIYGLTLDTDRYQIYKAILEGACFEQRLNLTNMERGGIAVEELRCIGGGARSAVWLQMKADITGKTVVSMECGEAGCLGAAMLAGIGAGVYRDAEEAAGVFVRKKRTFLPDLAVTERYLRQYEAYLQLYPSLSKIRR